MIMSDMVIVTTSKWRAMCAIVATGAFLAGVIATYVIWVSTKMWKEKQNGEKVITVFDSPQPTRNARLMTSTTHRKMAESMRARRRGGRRRYMQHRRSVTRIFDPPAEHDCVFSCLLRAAGMSSTRQNIDELRTRTAEKVYEAYTQDLAYHGHSVRHMIQDTGHTLAAYLALLRWRLWATPIEVCMAADVLGLSIVVSAWQGLIVHGAKPAFLVRLAKQHYTLHVLRKVPNLMTKASQGRGGMQNPSTWTWEHAAPNTVSILSPTCCYRS